MISTHRFHFVRKIWRYLFTMESLDTLKYHLGAVLPKLTLRGRAREELVSKTSQFK